MSRTIRGGMRLSDLLLGLLPFLFAAQLLSWLTFFPNALRGHADFRQLYTAGYMVRTGEGHRLYDYSRQTELQDQLVSSDERALPFIRPAYQAIVFAPLSWFRYRIAYLIFLAINIVLLAFTWRLLVPECGYLVSVWRGLPAALMLAFYPICLALMQGQDSIMLLLLLASTLHLLRRDRDPLAGFLAGVGLFKFQIVLPIAFLFLLWRRWRFCAGFSGAAMIAATASLVVAGGSQTMKFVHSILSVGGGASAGAAAIQFPLRVSIMANLRGLIESVGAAALSSAAITASIVVLSVALILWIGFNSAGKAGADPFIVAIVASILVSYYLFIHDLSVLLIPIVVALDRTASRFSLLSSSAALVWIAPTLVFLAPGHFYLFAIIIMIFLWSLTSQYRGAITRSSHEANWRTAVTGGPN